MIQVGEETPEVSQSSPDSSETGGGTHVWPAIPVQEVDRDHCARTFAGLVHQFRGSRPAMP